MKPHLVAGSEESWQLEETTLGHAVNSGEFSIHHSMTQSRAWKI